MKLLQLFEATRMDEIELPDLEVGDELMVGKFKNRNATIKGFKKDKHNQPVAKTDKGDQQIFKGRIKKLMDEAHNPNVRVKYMARNNAYYAYLGSTRVGQAQIYDSHDEKVGENERYIWKSAVHPDYKRQGIATAMYDAISKDLESKGLTLVPSPDTQLSDEAYAFWKARDPESLEDHGRTKSEPYKRFEGQEITRNNRPMVIMKAMHSVSGVPFFSARYTDVPKGSTNSVSHVNFDEVKDQLTEAWRIHTKDAGRGHHMVVTQDERMGRGWKSENLERDLMERFAQEDVKKLSFFWAHPMSGKIFHINDTHTKTAIEPGSPVGLNADDYGGIDNINLDDQRIFADAFKKGWVRSGYMDDHPAHGTDLGLHGATEGIVKDTLKMLIEKGLEVASVGLRGEFDGFEYDGTPEDLGAL